MMPRLRSGSAAASILVDPEGRLEASGPEFAPAP